MATPVQIALSAGYVALQGAAGRVCLYRGESVVAIVDDTGGAYEPRRGGAPSFDTITGSVITLRVSDIPRAPVRGEFVIDDANRRHRIETVERRGDFWRLACRPHDGGAR